MDQITIHLAEGFEEIEAVTIIDVLRRAGLNVVTVSISGKLLVNGAHHIAIQADMLFDKVDYTTGIMIILPGGMPGAQNLNNHSGLRSQILDYNKKGKLLGAICAAPLVLGNLGILNGRKAVCYPGFESYLNGADIVSTPIISADNVITGRGVGAALQFSLEIVRKLKGEEMAEKLRKGMLIDFSN